MTEWLGRAIVQGIDQTKPELLEVIVQLGLKGDKAAEELVTALQEGRVLMATGTENFGVLGNNIAELPLIVVDYAVFGEYVPSCGNADYDVYSTTTDVI